MRRIVILICCLLMINGVVQAQELTFEQLAAKVEQKLEAIDDLRAVFEAEVVESGQKMTMKMEVKWVKESKLTRIDFLSPRVLEGQFYIADAEKQELSVYVPMTNMLMVMPVQSAEEFGFDLPIGDFEKPIQFEDVKGEILRVEQTDRGLSYVVQIKELDQSMVGMISAGGSSDQAVQYVWFDADFMPVRFEYWDGEVCLAKLVIPEYEINKGVSAEELLAVPEDAMKVKM